MTCNTTAAPDGAGVFTKTAHGFRDGQQVTLSGGTMQVNSTAYTAGVYTVRNTTANTFELFDGSDPLIVTSFSSSPTFAHTTLVLGNVEGTFSAGEVVTGQTSNATATIQADSFGFKGVKTKEFNEVKQIGMAGSPTYTSDADLTSSLGANETITMSTFLLQIQVTY